MMECQTAARTSSGAMDGHSPSLKGWPTSMKFQTGLLPSGWTSDRSRSTVRP